MALGARVVDQVAHPIILRLVLNGAQPDSLLRTVADFDRSGIVDERLAEGVVNVFMNIDAFGSDADLSAVAEGTPEQRLGDCGNIDVRKNDRGVVAAHLKGHALHRVSGTFDDPFAGRA